MQAGLRSQCNENSISSEEKCTHNLYNEKSNNGNSNSSDTSSDIDHRNLLFTVALLTNIAVEIALVIAIVKVTLI